MGISRFLKGTTSFLEIENMPNWKSHTLYKEYAEWLTNEEAQQVSAQEEVVDEVEDKMTGGM